MKHSAKAKQIQHENTTHLDLQQYETFHDYTVLTKREPIQVLNIVMEV